MKRFLLGVVIALGVVTAIAATLFFSLGFWLSPQSTLAKSDAIVAISGGETRSRTEEAIRLYKEGWAPKLIFSGAALDPSSPSNALAMERIAVAEGVPAKDILLDETAANTNQNAAGVADIVQKNQMHQIILVTSPYHQRRASITFGRAMNDVKILNHSTTDENWRRSAWWVNDYSKKLTISELQKTLYVLWSTH